MFQSNKQLSIFISSNVIIATSFLAIKKWTEKQTAEQLLNVIFLNSPIKIMKHFETNKIDFFRYEIIDSSYDNKEYE